MLKALLRRDCRKRLVKRPAYLYSRCVRSASCRPEDIVIRHRVCVNRAGNTDYF
ncbi:hypothetical protein O9993_12015 [Vibrio lentus]|nr:hypothetical protein [Vibrio lentus]